MKRVRPEKGNHREPILLILVVREGPAEISRYHTTVFGWSATMDLSSVQELNELQTSPRDIIPRNLSSTPETDDVFIKIS